MLNIKAKFSPIEKYLTPYQLSPKPRTMREKLSIIDNLGLIAESTETLRPHLKLGKNRNTNCVKLADLWGLKSSQQLILHSKLSDAAQKFKFESWKNKRKINRLKGSPLLPHRMDRLLTKSPDIQLTPESTRAFRVYSPQVYSTYEKKSSVVSRVEMIDEIIKTCSDFKMEISRKAQGVYSNTDRTEYSKKRLKKNEIVGIKNIMRLLDHKPCE